MKMNNNICLGEETKDKKIFTKIKGRGVNVGVGGGRKKKLKNRICIMSKRKRLKALYS